MRRDLLGYLGWRGVVAFTLLEWHEVYCQSCSRERSPFAARNAVVSLVASLQVLPQPGPKQIYIHWISYSLRTRPRTPNFSLHPLGLRQISLKPPPSPHPPLPSSPRWVTYHGARKLDLLRSGRLRRRLRHRMIEDEALDRRRGADTCEARGSASTSEKGRSENAPLFQTLCSIPLSLRCTGGEGGGTGLRNPVVELRAFSCDAWAEGGGTSGGKSSSRGDGGFANWKRTISWGCEEIERRRTGRA